MTKEIPSFDILLEMAQQNPEELEKLRFQLAQETIDQAPERLKARLRGLQFQIDSTRKLAKTPMSACIQLSNMMHHSFAKLCNAVNGRPVQGYSSSQNENNKQNAQVLMFPSR